MNHRTALQNQDGIYIETCFEKGQERVQGKSTPVDDQLREPSISDLAYCFVQTLYKSVRSSSVRRANNLKMILP